MGISISFFGCRRPKTDSGLVEAREKEIGAAKRRRPSICDCSQRDMGARSWNSSLALRQRRDLAKGRLENLGLLRAGHEVAAGENEARDRVDPRFKPALFLQAGGDGER